MYSVVGQDGVTYGPVPIATIHQWIVEGRIVPSTPVTDPNTGQMVRADQILAIANIFRLVQPGMTAGLGQVSPYQQPAQPGYGGQINQGGQYAQPQYQPYGSPYGVPFGSPNKQKIVAALLAFFLGGVGAHKFYLGKHGMGVAMLCLTIGSFFTCGITGIIAAVWALVDFIQILCGNETDSQGLPLV